MGKTITVASLFAVLLAVSWSAAQVGPSNLKRGQALYEQNCARCHGVNGDGFGRDAQHLIVPPANFKSMRMRTRTDEDLFMAISNGVLFSPMHGWRERLSEQDMMDIVGYLRLLSPFSPIG